MKNIYLRTFRLRLLPKILLLTGWFILIHFSLWGQNLTIDPPHDADSTFVIKDTVYQDKINTGAASGTFISGTGVLNFNNNTADYNPSLAGVGIDSIIYEKNSSYDTLAIRVIPYISYDTTFTACENDGAFNINHAVDTPTTGTPHYYGTGVNSSTNEFEPLSTSGHSGSPYKIYAEKSVTVGSNTFTNTDSTTVTLKAAPDPFSLMKDTAYCPSQGGVKLWMENTQNNSYQYVLQKGGADIDTVPGETDSVAFPGTYTAGSYTAYAYVGGCSTPMNDTVTVSEITADSPNLEYITDSAFCPGGAGVELGLDSSEVGVNYILQQNGVDETTVAGTGSAISFGTYYDSTGHYAVEATNGVCDTSLNDTLKIYKKNEPEVYTLDGPGGFCQGESSIKLYLPNSETGIRYDLIKDGSKFTDQYGSTGDSVIFSITSTDTYHVIGVDTATDCTSPMDDTLDIVDYSPVNASVAFTDSTICNGESIVLEASGGDSAYSWTPVSSLETSSTISNPEAQPSNTTTYEVVVTDDNGCQETKAVDVTVAGIPTANAGTDTSVCKGDSVQLVADDVTSSFPDASYSWTPTSTLTDPTKRKTYADPETPTQYTLEVTSKFGCSSTDQITVDTNAVPNPSLSDYTVCNGESVTLKASGGNSYYWPDLDTTAQSVTVSPNSTRDYTVEASYTNGCSGTTDGQVQVNPTPTITATATKNPVCAGQMDTINTTVSGGTKPYQSYAWSPSGSGDQVDFQAPTGVSEVTYGVTVTDNNNCQDSTSVTVDINALPNVSISGLDSEYCSDEGPDHIYGTPEDANGEFLPASYVTDDGDGTGVFDPSALSPGNYTIAYRYKTDPQGCVDSALATTTISSDTIPDPSINGLDSTYCDNDASTYIITGSPEGSGGSFTYSPASGITDNGSDTAYLTPQDVGTGDHTITYTYTSPSGGCSASVTETFQIGVPFTFNLASNYCASQDTFQLMVDKPSNTAPGKFYVYDEDGDSILYSAKEGTSEAVFDPSSQGPGVYGVRYEVADTVMNCSNSDSVGFTVHSNPDAGFTLDGIPNDSMHFRYCNSDTIITLDGQVNDGGTYNGAGVPGGSNKFVPGDTTAGDYWLTYTYTNSTTGCSSTDSARVTIRPSPDVSINGLDPGYCTSLDTVYEITASHDSGYYSTNPSSDSSLFYDKGSGLADFNPSNAPFTGTFEITFTAVGMNGCSGDTTRAVSIDAPPAVSITDLPDTLCWNAPADSVYGNPTDANGKFIGPSFIKDNGDGTAVFDPDSASSPGTYDVIYRYTTPVSGCLETDTQSVTILPLPKTYSLQGGGSYCSGTGGRELRLSGSDSSVRYRLYKYGSLVEDTLRKDDGEFTFEGTWLAGGYSVKAKNTGGCTVAMNNTDTITEKYPPEDASGLSGTDTLAIGGTGSYSVPELQHTTSYVWNLPSGVTISSGSGNRSIDVSVDPTVAPGTDSVSVYGTNGSGCGDGNPDYYEVYILPKPEAVTSLKGKDTVCAGSQPLNYEAAPQPLDYADSIHWTVPYGFTITSGRETSSIVLDVAPDASSGFVAARGVNASGKGPADSIHVYVSEPPEINVSGLNSAYCSNDPATTIVATPDSGTYSSSWSTTVFVDSGDGTAHFDPSGLSGGSPSTDSIRYSITRNGCKADTTMGVTIYNAPGVAISGVPDIICENAGPDTLEGNPMDSNGQFTGTGVEDNGDGTAVFYPDTAGQGNHAVTYSYTDPATSCMSDTTYYIYVKEPPQTYTLTADGSYCEDTPGDTITLSGGETGVRYSVYEGGTALLYDTTLSANVGSDWVIDTAFTSGTYTVKATANGCTAWMDNSLEITKALLPSDANPLSMTGTDTVILDGNGSYSVDPIANTTTYHWIKPSSAAFQLKEDTTDVTIDFTGVPAGDHQIGVYGANHCGQGDTAYYDVYILPKPSQPDSISGDRIVCAGAVNVTYDAHPYPLAHADSVEWDVPGGFTIVDGKGTYRIKVDVAGSGAVSGDIRARGVNASGKGPWVSYPVRVKSIPDINFSGISSPYCDYAPEDTITALPDSGSYIRPSTWTSAALQDLGNGKAVVDPGAPGEGSYEIGYEIDLGGCSVDTSIQVEINAAPNVTFDGLPGDTTDLCKNSGSLSLKGNLADSNGYYKGAGINDHHDGTATLDPTHLSSGVYDIAYHYVDTTSGCMDTATQQVRILKAPQNYALKTVSGEYIYCEDMPGLEFKLSGGDSAVTYDLIKNDKNDVASRTLSSDGSFTFNGYWEEGTYSVYAVTSRGCKDTISNTVTTYEKALPEPAPPIWGDSIVPVNDSGSYHVAPIANSSSYQWIYPSDASITGNGSREVAISFDSAGLDSVGVYGRNDCGQGDTSYFKVDVLDKPAPIDSLAGDTSVCAGSVNLEYEAFPGLTRIDSIEWILPNGFTITSGKKTQSIEVSIDSSFADNGYVVARGVNGAGKGKADSLFVRVHPIPATNSVSISGELTCAVDSVLIDGNSTTSGASYTWVGGNKTVHDDSVYAPLKGEYTLTVEAYGCTHDTTVTVTENKTTPSAGIATPDTLTCDNPQETLQASTDAGNPGFVWTAGAGGNIVSGDSTATPTVDAPGSYTVTVVDSINGCTNTATITVEENVTQPSFSLNDPSDITCARDTAVISTPGVSDATYQWSGPSGGIVSGQNTASVVVGKTGDYSLTVTKNSNGCSRTKSRTVSSDSTQPAINSYTKTGDITCHHNQVNLEVDVDTTNVNYTFEPVSSGNIVSINNNIATVDAEDRYAVVATYAATGCSISDTLKVNDLRHPVNVNIDAAFTTLTCNQPYDTLTVTSDLTDKEVEWKATNGGHIHSGHYTSQAIVDSAGKYTATVTDTTTGCHNSEFVEVNKDFSAPVFNGITKNPDSLTCKSDVTLVADVSGAVSYSWSGPGNISPSDQDSVEVDQPGTYTLEATAANGCPSTDNVAVPADTSSPSMTLHTNYDDITCTNQKNTLEVYSSTSGVTYHWSQTTGSGNLSDNNVQFPEVDGAGTFKVVVTDADNGCTTEDQVSVDTNYTLPVIDNFEDNPDSISCANHTVELLGSSSTTNADLMWTVSSGSGNIYDETTETPTVDKKGEYTLTVTHPTTGCQVDSSVTVDNNFAQPVAEVDQNVGQITCNVDTLQLDGSASTGVNFNWNAVNGSAFHPNDSVAKPYITSDGLYILTVEHPHSGCTDKDSVEVKRNNSVPRITMGDVSADTLNCAVDSSILKVDYVDQPDYWWSTTDGNITSGANTTTVVVDAPGTYTFTAENPTTGCTNSKSVTIEEETTQPTFTLSANKLTCTRDTVQIHTDVGYATDPSRVSYAWTSSGGQIISGDENLPNPRVVKTGTYYLTLTDDVNGCTRTRSIKVTASTTPPNVSLDTPNDLTCSRTSVDLQANTNISDSSYLWTTTGSGNIVNQTTATPTVDAIGWYTVKVTNEKNGCYSEDSVYVDKNVSTPDVHVDPFNDITCSRTTVELFGSSSQDVYFSWSGGPGNISDPNSALTEVDGAGDYTLKVKDKVNGCSNDTTVTVEAHTDLPSKPVVSDTGSCYGQANVALTATGSNNRWYSEASQDPSTLVGTGDTYTPTMSSVGDSVFYVTQTGSNGCESPATAVTYTVYPLPDAPSATDKEVCFGQANPFLEGMPANSDYTINWYNTSDSLLSTSYQYQPTPTAPGTYPFGVTQVDANGCESPQTQAYFTIHDLPPAPMVDSDTLRVCEGAPAKTFIAHGDNIRWYNTTPPASPIASGNIFEPDVSGVGQYHFYVTQSESSTSCESDYKRVVYIIQPNPDPYTLKGGGTYCEGTGGREIYLDNSVDTISYELRRDGNTYMTNISGDGDSLTFGRIKPEGTYTVYGTAGNGCTARMSGTAVISVDSLPEAAGTIVGDSVVCQGATAIDYTVPEIPYADQYEWSVPAGAEIIAGENARTISVNYSDSAESGQITVYGANACGDGPVSTGHAITVNALPGPADSIMGPGGVCQGADGVTFEVPNIENASEYVWSVPAGATIVAGEGSRTIMVDFDASSTGGMVQVHGRNSCGTGASSPDHTIDITSKPIISAETYQSICSSSDSLIASDPGSATIQWALIDGQANIAHPTQFETEVTNLGTGRNAFEVTLTQNGCSDVDTVVIENNQRFVNAGADQTLCSSSYTLSGTQPASDVSGNWSIEQGSASFADAGRYNTEVTSLQKGVNVLRWTLTKNGCRSYDEVTIVNDSPTQAEAGINQQLCSDSTYLDANTPSRGGGQWTILNGYVDFESPTDPNTQITHVAKGDNLLQWTITNNACSTADTVSIVNNKVEVEAGPDQVICGYQTTLDALTPAKGDGQWSILRGSATFENRSDPKTKVYLLVSDTTVLSWDVYHNGCVSSDSMTIVNNSPTKADAGDDQEIFQDHTFMEANDPSKGSGEWKLLAGSANISDKTSPSSEITNLAYGENLFQWKVTYKNCISIDSVVIDNQSTGNITAGNDTTICTDEMRLSASEPVQGEGEWSVVKGSGTFGDKNSNTTMVRNLSRGENVLKWTIIGNGVISDKVTIINNAPTQANAGPDMTYCQDSAELSANHASIGQGKWKLIAGEGTFEDTTANNTMIHNLGTGKNTLRWTITNQKCQSTDDVVITNNKPTTADAGVDQTLCSSEATLYGNSPSVGQGLWTLVSGSNSVEFQDQTVGNTRVTNLGRGENTLRWTITNGNCVSSDSVTIINDNPTPANAGRDKSICVDSFELNASEAVIGQGTWTVINGYGEFVDSSRHNTQVRNLDKGGNVLRWSIEHNGCISYDEVEISNDLVEAEAGYDQSLCTDSTYLSANNPGRGEGYWSVITGSASFEDASDPNTNVKGLDHRSDNILKWTVSHKSCVSTDQVTIENNSPGIVYAGEDAEVCDDVYYLSANPNYIGEAHWEALSGGADIVKDSSANTMVKDMGLGRNTFRWTVRRDGCVKHNDVTIYNNMPVDAYAGENDTICSTTTTMHAEEPPFGTGQWSVVAGSGEFANDSAGNTTVTNLSQGANTFKWSIYNGRCSTTDEVTIVVNRPNEPRAGADQAICADSTSLQANYPGPGQTGRWEVVEGSGKFEDRNDPHTKVTHMSHGDNIYRWNISYKQCNLYDEVTITNKMPTEADAGQNIDVCGDQVRLNAVQTSIGNGHWSLVSGQAEFGDRNDPNTVVSNLGYGPNTLRWETTHGECTSMDEIIVSNKKATAYAGVDQEVYRDSTTLVANKAIRGEGTWILLGGSGTFAQPHSAQTKVRDLTNGVNTFRWQINNDGCISADEVSITYYEMPNPEFDVSRDNGCPPLTVQFYNESLKLNTDFTWRFGDENISTNENPRHTYYQPGRYEVTLKTQGPDGSSVSEDTTIVVHDLPEARFDVAPDVLYIPEQHLQCYDMSIDADRYKWHFGDDSTSNEPSPMHHYRDTGTYDIRLKVWSPHGCTDDTVKHDAVTVKQSGKIKFPSGFTPNPSGPVGGHYNENSKSNNIFHPIVKGVNEYHMEIFNRWGVKVFSTDKVDVGWDGYYKGKLAEEGVYIYKVHGTYNNGTRFEKVGDFVLIRK